MKFKKGASGGVNMIVAGALVLVPGILVWVLLGEFNVLGLDYLHALGAPSGNCYADESTSMPVACAEGARVLLYDKSLLDWRVAVACCALIPWSVLVCTVFCFFKLTSLRIFPYAVSTSFLVIGIAFSAAIPHANDALLVFARVVIALVAAALGFLVTNLVTNAAILLADKGRPVYEQMSKEITEAKLSKEQEDQKRKQKGAGNEKDYVEDIKR